MSRLCLDYLNLIVVRKCGVEVKKEKQKDQELSESPPKNETLKH
jgi:hypothetical protein